MNSSDWTYTNIQTNLKFQIRLFWHIWVQPFVLWHHSFSILQLPNFQISLHSGKFQETSSEIWSSWRLTPKDSQQSRCLTRFVASPKPVYFFGEYFSIIVEFRENLGRFFKRIFVGIFFFDCPNFRRNWLYGGHWLEKPQVRQRHSRGSRKTYSFGGMYAFYCKISNWWIPKDFRVPNLRVSPHVSGFLPRNLR